MTPYKLALLTAVLGVVLLAPHVVLFEALYGCVLIAVTLEANRL